MGAWENLAETCRRIGDDLKRGPADRRRLADLAAELSTISEGLDRALSGWKQAHGVDSRTLQADTGIQAMRGCLAWVNESGHDAAICDLRQKIFDAQRNGVYVLRAMAERQSGWDFAEE
jgi:hypothetical protein